MRFLIRSRPNWTKLIIYILIMLIGKVNSLMDSAGNTKRKFILVIPNQLKTNLGLLSSACINLLSLWTLYQHMVGWPEDTSDRTNITLLLKTNLIRVKT